MKKRFGVLEYKGLLAIAAIFAVIAVILFFERSGIQAQYNVLSLSAIPKAETVTKADALAACEKNCLVLMESGNPNSELALEQFEVILMDMKVGYDLVDLTEGTDYRFEDYSTAVLLLDNLSVLGEKLLEMDQWVYQGGGVLLPLTLVKESYFSALEAKFGIVESSYEYGQVESIYVTEDFMIGGGRSFEITDPWDSALIVRLQESDRVTVHGWTGEEHKIPLIWESQYGSGKFVLDNFGIYEREMRGFYAASYTLLQPVTAYPVINSSTFYLDDFPSQIPSGSNEYIWRDYGISVRDFYGNIWWPDMMNFADQYGLKYTGLVIQCYDDNVDGTTTPMEDTGTFLNYGNMLLRMGGELGYHGYNHQPLCLGNSDYNGIYDYQTWESESAMKSAFDTLVDLCDGLFPTVEISIYVPPSNLLSEEGKAFLIKNYPQISTISGIYFEEDDLDFCCTQEFGVTEEGIVEQPRIISGCYLEPYMELAAISELNFHYVNSHFTHPDDSLDPDRGAEMGWEELSRHFNDYLDWLYTSAPNIRNFTGSEMAAAVARFSALTVSTELSEDQVSFELGNFYDEAQLMVRFNDRTPERVEGGQLEQITDTLYLLQADSASVTITLA